MSVATSPIQSNPSSPTASDNLNILAPLRIDVGLIIKPPKAGVAAGDYIATTQENTINFRPQVNSRAAPYSAVPASDAYRNSLWSPSLGRLISQTHNSLAFLVPVTPRHEPGNTPTSPSGRLSKNNSSRTLGTTNKFLSPREISSRQYSRTHRAQMKRAYRKQERKMKHVTRDSLNKHRKQIVEQTIQLKQLKTKLKSDFQQASADIRRKMILQKRVETLGKQGEYQMSVSLLARLRRTIMLKKSISTSFLDAMYQTKEEEEDEIISATLDDGSSDVSSKGQPEEYEEGYRDLMDNFDSLLSLPANLGFEYELEGNSSPDRESAFALTRSMSVPELISKTASRSAMSLRIVFGELLPPITRFTLEELDIDHVLTNWKTRHDLVFDPDLTFKPNSTGTRGAAQRELREEFWKSIKLEDTDKILLLINEVKAIICEIVTWPEHRLQQIDEVVDIALIEQQIKSKTYNPAGTLQAFLGWIKDICAPIRDAEIDELLNKVSAGQFLEALEGLFNVCENIKLDIVNNGLRNYRHWVVQEAPSFELREFHRAIQRGHSSLMKTTYWLCQVLPPCKDANPTFTPKEVFYTCFVDLVRAYSTTVEGLLPETFELDAGRIRSFYSSWEDIAILANVLMVFRQALGAKAAVVDTKDARARLKILLEDRATAIDNIHFEIALLAGKLRGKPFNEQETEAIGVMLNKTLTAGNKVYDLILTRVGLHLATKVRTNKFDETLLTKQGMIDLLPELEKLGDLMRFLADHNLSIFDDTYANISKQIFSEEPLSDEEESQEDTS